MRGGIPDLPPGQVTVTQPLTALLLAIMALEEIRKMQGKWKVVRSENFDEFMQEIGLNFIIRKMAALSSPEMKISIHDDETIHIVTTTSFMTQEATFKLGEEFTREFQKVKMKCIASWEDGKLKIDQKPLEDGVKPQVVHRELDGEELVQTMYIGDVVCKRFFRCIG